MRRVHRLRSTDDFTRVRRVGRSWAHPLLILYAARNEVDTTRVGISVSKKVGDAVTRNRVRRRVREAMRLRLAALPQGWDLMFVVRAPAADSTYGQLDEAAAQLLTRAGLLVPESWDASPKE